MEVETPSEPVSPAYQKRIDSDEPWRYTCPECESTDVHRYTFEDRVKGRRYTALGEIGRNELKDDLEARYRCDYCNVRLHEVYDKKAGALVTP